ncbi:restriction endonuclease subunit S [Lactobacillus delbrueckii]|uniref:restriction endonuclease subunit S n=1 Tax=Lactobacillus delbrueckii TaxID=1584 RepID=UPI0021A90500|nr:restriction endonuclease subunit S [Lactobacillus delbrueckii]
MKDEKKAPKLRFKGFTDDWEQCKLGDVYGHLYSGNTPSRKNSANFGGDTPWIRTADLNNGLIKSTTEFLTYEGIKQLKILPENTIVLAMYGGFNQIGRTGILGFPATINQALVALTPHKNINQFFAQSYLNRHIIDWRRVAASSRKDPNITKEDVEKSEFSFGSLEEQNRISKLISRLDHTITLHEEKKQQLKCLKSALLQKMFANKSGYPAVRFERFSNEWEQCKLGDVANFSKGTGYSKSDLKRTGSPIILYGCLYTKYETIIRNVDTFVVPKSGSVFSKGGEVIVPGSGETAEDISIASVVEPTGILLGGDLNIIYPNSDLDPTFLAITISHGKPHFDMARRAQGKSIVHLHNADLKHISLKTPNLSEQKRISKIFEVFDQTITLHDQKLSLLKRVKQTLLQKMFI